MDSSNEEEEELLGLFRQVAALVRESPDKEASSSSSSIPSQVQLSLYGLYKHSTEGPCGNDAPSGWFPTARAKHAAWYHCRHLTKLQAMLQYVQGVARLDHPVGRAALMLLDQYNNNNNETVKLPNNETTSKETPHTTTPNSQSPNPPTDVPPTEELPNASSSSLFSSIPQQDSFLSKIVTPVQPRGQLDVSVRDLIAGWNDCFTKKNTLGRYVALERTVEQVWHTFHGKEDSAQCPVEPVIGLSVRSLLDLYLRVRSFPPQSSVIVTPPINIPGMMEILQRHDIHILPVEGRSTSNSSSTTRDGGPEDGKEEDFHSVLQVDCAALQEALQESTVAILVVHPFGATSVTDWKCLEKLASTQKVELWSDMAECYAGLTTTYSHHDCDVAFVSFGTIKTATALGGGVALLKNTELAQSMRHAQYRRKAQTHGQYARKILWALIIKAVCQFPLLYGLLVKMCTMVGGDWDAAAAACVRSIPLQAPSQSRLGVLRQRPSVALLRMLRRRLQQSDATAAVVQARISTCDTMSTLLKRVAPYILQPCRTIQTNNTHWLFPILVPPQLDPQKVARSLLTKGWDVPRGASSLQCIAPYASNKNNCTPHTQQLMDRLLYLPVTSQPLTTSQMHQLAMDLKVATTTSNHDLDTPCPCPRHGRGSTKQFVVIFVGLLSALWTVGCHQLLLGGLWNLTKLGVLGGCLACGGAVAVRWFMGDFYVDGGSRGFAKYYSSLWKEDNASRLERHETRPCADDPLLPNMDSLRIPTPRRPSSSIEGPYVLLTGATGYIGSLLLRDLLLHRDKLGLEGVIVLCRPKRGVPPAARISKLLEDSIFSFLTKEEKKSLVTVVQGDVTQRHRVGLSDKDWRWVCQEVCVSQVLHCAAAVSFTQSLEEAATANITSALNLLSLTESLQDKRARYIHVSTAFVHGAMTGSDSEPLAQDLFPLGSYDAAEIYRSMLGTQFYASSAMADLSFPNTYTFSKCICEHLLLRRTTVDTIIIRPSIVGPALREPYQGWAGKKPSTLVAGICLYLRYQGSIWCFGDHRVPVIPVDVVSRFIIGKAFSEKQRAPSPMQQTPPCASPCPSSSDDDFERVSRMSEFSSSASDDQETDSSLIPDSRASIYTAAWDSSSCASCSFTWIDFVLTITHAGSVTGRFSRFTAYVGLLFAAKILPRAQLSRNSFEMIHSWFVKAPINAVVVAFDWLGWHPTFVGQLSRLRSFLDLPLLFFPFTNHMFSFHSELVACNQFSGEKYLLTCVTAAIQFLDALETQGQGKPKQSRQLDKQAYLVGGALHNQYNSDLWWALTQPRGSLFIRFGGWLFAKILRASTLGVTVDLSSFEAIAACLSEGKCPHIVLAPTHRSFFDFILISYVIFALPELGLDLPSIAAADEFSRLSVINWLVKGANAFFVRRGRGAVDPQLEKNVAAIKDRAGGRGACFEIFIEGTRSRDRRFLEPKTGLLRCLAKTGGEHTILPICINYETIPEQSTFLKESESGFRSSLGALGLMRWIQAVFSSKVKIGRIHIASAPLLSLNNIETVDFASLAREIQQRQQGCIFISDYHVSAAAAALALDPMEVKRALVAIKCRRWPELTSQPCIYWEQAPPDFLSQQWAMLLQFAPQLACFFQKSHPRWFVWLNSTLTVDMTLAEDDASVRSLINRLSEYFEMADASVAEALSHLHRTGFEQPKADHVLQIAMRENKTVPAFLLRAAVSFQVGYNIESSQTETLDFVRGGLELGEGPESLGYWGFKDSGFVLRATTDSSPSVVMKGTRYDLCGKPLKKLIPFIESETAVRINLSNEAFPCGVRPSTNQCCLSQTDLDDLSRVVSRVSVSTADCARHGTGHSQEDVFLLRSGQISTIRIPDAVVWPSSEEEVADLVSLSKTNGWCLIPHGGGTNVSHATRCPSLDVEPRPIISVDMKDMHRILWINEEDGVAHVEAGITGRALLQEMELKGYTIGHEPDSIEFSTLGGWIATKASGMKRSKYGNIEDIVKAVHVVGSQGPLWKGTHKEATDVPGRESRNTELCSLMVGSEGCLGIITSAVIRIWPLPEHKDYDSVLLADFEHGLRFVRDLVKLGPNLPASVRLLDNAHFRLGQALREEPNGFVHLIHGALVLLSQSLRSYSRESVVCATISFEGSFEEVQAQRKALRKIASQHGGTLVGPGVGRAGYQLTFAIAYLRDFAMTFNFLGESFETFAPWSKIATIVQRTKLRIEEEHTKRSLPGKPFVGCRVTQLYHEGVCLYFYFCMNFEGVPSPCNVFAEIEHAAREEILSRGGSLSHHHGIGKVRSEFTKRMDSGSFRTLLASLKHSVDPSNTFGARNGVFD